VTTDLFTLKVGVLRRFPDLIGMFRLCTGRLFRDVAWITSNLVVTHEAREPANRVTQWFPCRRFQPAAGMIGMRSRRPGFYRVSSIGHRVSQEYQPVLIFRFQEAELPQ
jgi:hypothetical protein